MPCRALRAHRSPEGHTSRILPAAKWVRSAQSSELRTLPFETAIIEHYRRRESKVEEALVEMYLAAVSVRRVEDITEALWVHRSARAR